MIIYLAFIPVGIVVVHITVLMFKLRKLHKEQMKHYDEFDKYFEGIEKELAAIRKRD
jgi:hypothetical protein